MSDGTINVIERKWLGTTVALGDLTVVKRSGASLPPTPPRVPIGAGHG
ncbi:MAG: hypothetical protein ACLTDR_05755 [Adlercreutzia equolifaciens]